MKSKVNRSHNSIGFSFFLTFAVYLTCACGLSIGVTNGYAQVPRPSEPQQKGTAVEKIDRYHKQVGETLLNSSEWIDRFFATENYTEEINKTYLRIRLTGFMEDGEGFDGNARFKLRLKLPGTKKRLRLTIGTDPDVIDTLDDSPDDVIRDRPNEVEDDTKIGLEYFFFDRDRHNLKFSGGVRIRSGTVVGYGSTRYRYLRKFDLWSMRFNERLRWYTDDGWDSRTEIDFERPVTDRLFFRAKPTLNWFEERDGFNYGLNTSLYHAWNKNIALEYQFNIYFYTELSGQLQETNVRVRYRQRIWRQWLIMEVAPQLAWYESRDFETVPGILIRFEIWIGRFKTPEIGRT